MKQLLAWTGSADSAITSEDVMAMAERNSTLDKIARATADTRTGRFSPGPEAV
jgi:hypothetical protein